MRRTGNIFSQNFYAMMATEMTLRLLLLKDITLTHLLPTNDCAATNLNLRDKSAGPSIIPMKILSLYFGSPYPFLSLFLSRYLSLIYIRTHMHAPRRACVCVCVCECVCVCMFVKYANSWNKKCPHILYFDK